MVSKSRNGVEKRHHFVISGVLGDFPLTRGYLDGDVTNAYLAVDPHKGTMDNEHKNTTLQ